MNNISLAHCHLFYIGMGKRIHELLSVIAAQKTDATFPSNATSFSPINEPLLFSSPLINNIPRFCGSQNKNDIGCLPDLFPSESRVWQRKTTGMAASMEETNKRAVEAVQKCYPELFKLLPIGGRVSRTTLFA